MGSLTKTRRKRPSPGRGRRAFLKGVAGGAFLICAGDLIQRTVRSQPSMPSGPVRPSIGATFIKAKLREERKTKRPTKADFDAALAASWMQKVEACPDDPRVLELAELLPAQYERLKTWSLPFMSTKPMTIEEYLAYADSIIVRVDKDMDWDAFARLYRLAGDDHSIFHEARNRVDGKALVAYALTEHRAEDGNGALNREFFDYMLRYGGREFVERIPSGADGFPSYGPYQFTTWALSETNGTRRGASIANQALDPASTCRIPADITLLSGDDHLTAAYLFALHNLAHLIGALPPTGPSLLKRLLPDAPTFVPEFIAAAHHHPPRAIKAGTKWVQGKAGRGFRQYCEGLSLVRYVATSSENYAVL